MVKNFISEDDIEQELLKKLNQEYHYQLLNCKTTDPADLNDRSGRTDKRDVILRDQLIQAALNLNPEIPSDQRPEIVQQAIDKIMERRTTVDIVTANRELDHIIRNGYQGLHYTKPNGQKEPCIVKLINFNQPDKNQYLAVSQLWIKSTANNAIKPYRRPDVILYINGLPLVFIELKNSNVKLQTAYSDNLSNYKNDIPQLFHPNGLCILSNAIDTRIGSITATWQHFFSWLRVEDEKELIDRQAISENGTSLERVIEGLCDPRKLLDYLENYIIYYQEKNKIIAQNHQFIGVNNAFTAFRDRQDKPQADRGKLGVFWHTQGSGKSFSMIFYARKILRKLPGNYTFLVISDRKDLNGQIYRNFLHTKTVKKEDAAEPNNSEELRKFLGQNKPFVFTLIHKFGYDKGKQYPILTQRDDVIVIVDEAHRSQYKSLADNMRAGLPNANYLAFTGTPLLGRDKKTHAWFGDYVSQYNFRQAMDDNATVPLVYQKRVPQVLIQNEDLSEEFYELLEDENLDDAQQEKLEKTYSSELEIITRSDRLDTIAEDIAYHFPRRGYLGKGMVICVDKYTAVKMYNKVQHYWKENLKTLRGRIKSTDNDLEKARLKKILDYMKRVEMAVVISQEGDEDKKFQDKGLDIKPHRQRMEALDDHGHDVEYNFKDPEHPLQIVFVCAMWLTGFDAPTVSTLYLDKPMKGHTLMQTIARANRVAPFPIQGLNGNWVEKTNGEVIDYYNVFRNMRQALKDYTDSDDGDQLVPDKSQLFVLLNQAIAQTVQFCEDKAIDLWQVINENNTFKNIGLFQKYADILVSKDEWRKSFRVYDNTVSSLYEACKPEIHRQDSLENRPLIAVIAYLRGILDQLVDQVDTEAIKRKIDELLDQSVVVDGEEQSKVQEFQTHYQIIQKGKTLDLSKIDFDQLRQEFKQAEYKNLEIADLRSFIDHKLQQMLTNNCNRIDFAQRFQAIVDRYNAGASSTENYFEELLRYTEDLKQEEERHIRLGLTEDELELFDILKKDKLTKAEEEAVKLAAKSLIQRLREAHPKVLVQDWYKDTQSKQRVRTTVEEVLDQNLPDSYDRLLFKDKCESTFDLILDFASHGRKWAA